MQGRDSKRYYLRMLGSLAVVVVVAAPGIVRGAVATRPTEPLPLVEVQVKNTAIVTDDYVGFAYVACRARIRNPTTGGLPTFSSDIKATLRAFREAGGGRLLFGTTIFSSGSTSLNVTLPASGGWRSFLVKGGKGGASALDKDVAIEVVENRKDGIVLARKALMVTTAPPTSMKESVEIQINQTETTIDDYVTWAPTVVRIRRAAGAPGAFFVTVRNMPGSGDHLRFANVSSLVAHRDTATATALTINLPTGVWRSFYVAGNFLGPSTRDKDAVIEVRAGSVVLGREAAMVRVRKNANTLTTVERNRFRSALARLNMGLNLYSVYQDIHFIGIPQAHGGPGFLPWHRVFVLRLERELQAIDPGVALHWWRFDQAAPNVFHPDFMGDTPPGAGLATFSPTNPLAAWTIGSLSGVVRRPVFLPADAPGIASETATLALGDVYSSFRTMEDSPHGSAHIRGGGGRGIGWLSDVTISVRDPLFFLLHCNVDRLWAKWQWVNGRWDPSSSDAFTPQGPFSPSGAFRKGHYSLDTMWPWNGVTGLGDLGTPLDDRPATAPGGPFPQVLGFFNGPPAQPRPWDVNDYGSNRRLAVVNQGLGFAYQDVPYR